MGKQWVAKKPKVQLDNSDPGCKWGIFQILYHHHWRHVKKMFSHKKHHCERHARYTRGQILFNHYCDESQESEGAEAEPILVRELGPSVEFPKSRSPKRNQANENCKYKISSPPAGKQLHSSWPKHELEPSDNCIHCLSNFGNKADDQAARNPVPTGKQDRKLLKNAGSQEFMRANKQTADVSIKMKEYSEVLEILKGKKDMFLKILQDLDVNTKPTYNPQASNSSAKLIKSGSFPVVKPSVLDSKYTRFSTLKHKQTEIWAFPKVEQLHIASEAHEEHVPSPTDNRRARSGMKAKPRKSSTGTSVGSNQQSWNQLVVHRFKIMKKKIKHALTEFKKDKDSKQNSTEAINQKISSEKQEVTQSIRGSNEDWRDFGDNFRDSHENLDSNISDISDRKVPSVTRTTSLNESLDRYTNLFELSFGKDSKWKKSKSKSLKLTNEDKVRVSRSTSMSYRRNLSLPDHIFLYEASHDSHNSSMPERNSVHAATKSGRLSFDTDVRLDAIEGRLENESVENCDGNTSFSSPYDLAMVENNENIAQLSELWDDKDLEGEVTSRCGHASKEIECTRDPRRDLVEQAQEVVILESKHQDHIASYTEDCSIAESSHTAEPGCSIDLPNTDSKHSIPDCTFDETDDEVKDIQPADKGQQYHFLHPEFDVNNCSDYEYVKYILQYLGIVEDEHSGIWQMTEDLLSESLSKDIEGGLANEFTSSGDYITYLHHRLLFDLLKDVVLDIRETSCTYFPRSFSFNSITHPIQKGHRLIQEVWRGTNFYLSLRPELDQSLDEVVGRDLAKGTWVNLQLEAECITLELEEIIVEELLDEVIFSWGCRY